MLCVPVRPYRPSNGTEGDIFESQWCEHCTRDAAFRSDPERNDGCPILAAVYALNIDEPGYPKEWIEDSKGPRCTAYTDDKIPSPRCLHTMEMFPETLHV